MVVSRGSEALLVAVKLVVSRGSAALLVAMKLKYHRLKPGGVPWFTDGACSCEVEEPPAKAWWCPKLMLKLSKPERAPYCLFNSTDKP